MKEVVSQHETRIRQNPVGPPALSVSGEDIETLIQQTVTSSSEEASQEELDNTVDGQIVFNSHKLDAPKGFGGGLQKQDNGKKKKDSSQGAGGRSAIIASDKSPLGLIHNSIDQQDSSKNNTQHSVESSSFPSESAGPTSNMVVDELSAVFCEMVSTHQSTP